jgi:hypothetical protein
MDRIEQEVRRELQRFGAPGGLPAVLDTWPDAVGPEITRNAWPARITRDNTLHVATSSSAWAFELSQLAPDVLERLRERLGPEAPDALRFAPGRLPEADPAADEETAPQLLTPSPADIAEASSFAAAIGDEELRKRVQRAAALSLVKSRSGR